MDLTALLLSRPVADQLKYDDMGTTFGGGGVCYAGFVMRPLEGGCDGWIA